MSRMSPLERKSHCLVALLITVSFATSRAVAQTPPQVTPYSPTNGSHVSSASITITVSACADHALTGSKSIKLNNVALNTLATGANGCTGGVFQSGFRASGTLHAGANTIDATICDANNNCGIMSTATVYYDPPVSHVVISPTSWTTTSLGATQSITAKTYDASFNELTGRSISWSSNNTAVVMVSPNSNTSPGTVTATAAGYGSATITATSGSISGTVSVQVNPPVMPGVSVTPQASTQTLSPRATNGSANFSVRNTTTGDGSAVTFTLTTSCTLVVSCSSNSASPSTVTLTPSDPAATVTLSYSVSASGTTGTVTLSASATGVPTGSGVTTVNTTPSYTVQIIPASSSQSVTAGTSNSYSVQIQNTSMNTTQSITASVGTPSCSNVTLSSCSVPSNSASLSQGEASAAVAFSYFAVAVGSESVTIPVSASTSGYTVGLTNGILAVTVNTPPTSIALAPLRPINAATTRARDQCLTISAGGAAASECGELRLVHSFPATITMNKARAPTLIYNSRDARPGVLIAANVNVAGAPQPTSIDATLTIPGKPAITKSFAWNAGCLARDCRIVIPVDAMSVGLTTGVYQYTLEVKATNGQTPPTASRTDTLVIVDRSTSPFGPGWWLDGLEQLVTVSATQQLWIGGDGSTRLYTQSATDNTVYLVQPTVDRPDTLKRVVGNSTWQRRLRNGAYVEFDNAGRHTATVNRYGQRTSFFYTNALSRLELAVPAGTTPPGYDFTYDVDGSGNPRVLHSVTAPQTPNKPRVTTVSHQPSWSISSITEPNSAMVGFLYSSVGDTILARRNRTGDTTFFTYNEAGLLRQVSIDMRRTDGVSAPPLVSALCPAESRGLASCAAQPSMPGANTPHPLSQVYTFFDGPRDDVLDVKDTTAFFVNRWGAPDSTINALGDRTKVERTDVNFPMLVTALVQPNGHRVESVYTSRALLDHTTDINPYGDGQNATTTYAWDLKWDDATCVTSPTGVVTTFFYEATTGNRLWTRPGDNPSRQVTFTYNASGQVATVTAPLTQPESYFYDALGNLNVTRSPIGFYTVSYKDALGRDTLTITPIDSAAARDTVQLKTNGAQVHTTYNLAGLPDSTIKVGAARPYTLHYVTSWTQPILADTLNSQSLYDFEGRVVSVSTLSEPDQTDVWIQETFTYDAAGRATRHSKNGHTDVTSYDPAGNATSLTRVSGYTVTSRYDALNRLAVHTVPARSTARQRCEGFMLGPITSATIGNCYVVFPAYPNDASNGYTVPLDSSMFTYDALGNMLTADNGDAKVHRQYFANGALQRDSLYHRAANLLTFGAGSGLEFKYDRSGARRWVKLPSGDTLGYRYHNELAALDTIVDQRGNKFRYVYDVAGRIDSVVVNTPADVAGVWEKRWYDPEGRQYQRERRSAALGLLSSDSIRFDALGRVTKAKMFTAANMSAPDTTYFYYSGLGAILARERHDGSTLWESEEFRVEAFGNVLVSRAGYSDKGGAQDPRYSTLGRRGALLSRSTTGAPVRELDQLAQTIDIDGNVYRSQDLVQRVVDNHWTMDTPAIDYYDAEGRLRAAQRYAWYSDNAGSPATLNGSFDEYRYDALGRRVMVISHRGDGAGLPGCTAAGMSICETLCNSAGCVNSVTRSIWDGNQLIREDKVPYPDGSPTAPYYGSVEYVHGLELDHALAVLDYNMYGVTRVLNPSWRGLFESSVNTDGTGADCSLPVSGSCTKIAWPDGNGVYMRPLPFPSGDSWTNTWMGSLVADQQDATGHLFRRNRYFDPQSGHFTQEDPAGLAAGMNLYGFAAGDPVNYSDPFGLCPPGGSGFAAVYCLLGLDARMPYTASPSPNRGVYVGVSGRVGTERTTYTVGAGKEPLTRSVCLTCTTPVSGSAFVGVRVRDKSPDEPGMSISVGPVGADNEGLQVGPSTLDGCPGETCIEVERTTVESVATRPELRTLPDNTRTQRQAPPPNRVLKPGYRY